MELRQKIIKEMVRLKLSLVPMHYCPDGAYEDFDAWDAVFIDSVCYDINFHSDGDNFYITAYHTTYDGHTLTREDSNFFSVLTHKLRENTLV